MSTLILPAAGRSSRFPGMRPKWLLTMPNGLLMFEQAISKLDLKSFDHIILVCLREHIESYLTEEKLNLIINNFNHNNFSALILEFPTSSQAETVALALSKADISGPFLVKDCDNEFSFNWSGANQVATLDLNNVDFVDAKTKSYVATDSFGSILNIIEKKVISSTFCCGGYGFESAREFIEHYDSINSQGEIYISHIIFSMIMAGVQFKISTASDYCDWGTLREYDDYKSSFLTVFCDIDGVLLINGSKFSPNGWKTDPIIDNIRVLSLLQKRGRLYLVVTSSRPASDISYISKILLDNGLVPDQYVMDLPHCKRVLVNDYAATNPYPSALCINIERDSKKLSLFLDSI